jgi:hypothetical protein
MSKFCNIFSIMSSSIDSNVYLLIYNINLFIIYESIFAELKCF